MLSALISRGIEVGTFLVSSLRQIPQKSLTLLICPEVNRAKVITTQLSFLSREYTSPRRNMREIIAFSRSSGL